MYAFPFEGNNNDNAKRLEYIMRIPKHVGIIPDGNRRWAQKNGMTKECGYDFGIAPGINLLHFLENQGVSEISIYGFTVDNCKRPAVQQKAFKDACIKLTEQLVNEKVSLFILGDSSSKSFPEELQPYTKVPEKKDSRTRVNLLVNYGWQWDLSHMTVDGTPHSESISRMDLIIRWGGMRRLSGFMPIQSVYSDFYIEDALWPDYEDIHVEHAFRWYDKQDVTLGG